MKLRKLLLATAVAVIPFVAAAPAKAFTLSYDVSDFETNIGETSIADDGSTNSNAIFGAQPSSDIANQASYPRTAASGLNYTIYDINFSNSTTNQATSTGLTPGSAGGDIASTSNLYVEGDPNGVGQSVNASYWGIDSQDNNGSGGEDNTTRNALLIAFDRPVKGFGVDLIDFESDSAFTEGQVYIYNGDANQADAVFNIDTANWSGDNPNGKNGNRAINFINVAGTGGTTFDRVAFVLGDDNGGNALNEAWAAGNFRFAASDVEQVPEPLTILGSIAAIGFGTALRKKLLGAEAAE
ncbi:MAG: PEP-CTERM sorting domain-containing protein [Cyanobacteria bacterium J06621_15]